MFLYQDYKLYKKISNNEFKEVVVSNGLLVEEGSKTEFKKGGLLLTPIELINKFNLLNEMFQVDYSILPFKKVVTETNKKLEEQKNNKQNKK